jgi:hypothetical protein
MVISMSNRFVGLKNIQLLQRLTNSSLKYFILLLLLVCCIASEVPLLIKAFFLDTRDETGDFPCSAAYVFPSSSLKSKTYVVRVTVVVKMPISYSI